MLGSEKPIVIEARALSSGGGVSRYAQELVTHMHSLLRERLVVLCDREATIVHGKSILAPLASPLLLPWWINVSVPRVLRSLKPGIVHFTKAQVPRRKQFPTVVTIHDVIPLFLPQTQSLLRRWGWPGVLKLAAVQSDHIITVSNASKQGIIKYFEVDPTKITVTPLAADTIRFTPHISQEQKARVAQHYGIRGKYILFVGTRDIRKNIQSLIQAFSQIAGDIPHTLVIAGKAALAKDTSKELVHTLSVQSRVIFLDFVPDDLLPALYAGADLFVWPSIYEGWGFPPQEAMASGVPVIVSDGGSLPEVVGQAAEVVSFTTENVLDRLHDKDFVSALAARMRLVLTDVERRQQLIHMGLSQVAKTSWTQVAQQTLDVYTQVMSRYR